MTANSFFFVTHWVMDSVGIASAGPGASPGFNLSMNQELFAFAFTSRDYVTVPLGTSPATLVPFRSEFGSKDGGAVKTGPGTVSVVATAEPSGFVHR